MPLHSQHIEWILKNERHTVQRIRLPEFPMAAFGRKDDDTASVFAVAENLPRPDMRPYAEAYALLLRSLPFRRTTLYIRSIVKHRNRIGINGDGGGRMNACDPREGWRRGL